MINPLQTDSSRWHRNRKHWEETLDSANLGRSPAHQQLARQVTLYETADVRWALGRLEPLRDRLVVDIGGGLALGAILMARRGARVVITDIAASRLKLARQSLAALGLADRVHLVAGSAEHLPFADGTVDRLFTKSVLIHTDLAQAAPECARVLAPAGRAAFIEPMRRNPFVNLYRQLAAPKIWRDITTYFGPGEIRTVREAMHRRGKDLALRPFFLLAFWASLFAFVWRSPAAYRLAERVLMTADRELFRRFPGLRQRAWLLVLVAKPRHRPNPDAEVRRSS